MFTVYDVTKIHNLNSDLFYQSINSIANSGHARLKTLLERLHTTENQSKMKQKTNFKVAKKLQTESYLSSAPQYSFTEWLFLRDTVK